MIVDPEREWRENSGKSGVTFLFPPVLTERLENAGVGTPTVMGSIQAFTDSVRPQYSISLTTCHDHAVEALAVALPFVAM